MCPNIGGRVKQRMVQLGLLCWTETLNAKQVLKIRISSWGDINVFTCPLGASDAALCQMHSESLVCTWMLETLGLLGLVCASDAKCGKCLGPEKQKERRIWSLQKPARWWVNWKVKQETMRQLRRWPQEVCITPRALRPKGDQNCVPACPQREGLPGTSQT